MLNQRKDITTTTTTTSNGNASSSGNISTQTCNKTNSREVKEKEKEDRETLVLWKRPLTTLYYFTMEVFTLLKTYGIQWVISLRCHIYTFFYEMI